MVIFSISCGEKTKPIQSQTKPICRPSAGNPKLEALNPKQEKRELKDSSESKFERVCLKKQNQNRPLAGNSKHEARNPKRVERVRFEKTKPISKWVK